MLKSIDNFTIPSESMLITPSELIQKFPLSSNAAQQICLARSTISKIMHGNDRRLLVIVGPCSIHDCKAALEYASLLKIASTNYADELFIVMRTYLEKPRTVIGWKGLISDPFLDGSFEINEGLKIARKFLIDLSEINIPTATELLDINIPNYLSDLISWVAIGARTTESQIHREAASGLSMPVGFKNTTDGNVKIAIDALQTACQPHHILGMNPDGVGSIIMTKGNNNCHVVLRGSNSKSNYSSEDIKTAITMLKNQKLTAKLMVDCSHGNSMKDHQRQTIVIDSIIQHMKKDPQDIFGVMIESNLISGKQSLAAGKKLNYGQSITDGCISWDETLLLLNKLAQTVRLQHKQNKL
jgi:3-deoxy-7-phosphoheptulonate synthase